MDAEEKLKLIAERLPGMNRVVENARRNEPSNFEPYLQVIDADLHYIEEVINDHSDGIPE